MYTSKYMTAKEREVVKNLFHRRGINNPHVGLTQFEDVAGKNPAFLEVCPGRQRKQQNKGCRHCSCALSETFPILRKSALLQRLMMPPNRKQKSLRQESLQLLDSCVTNGWRSERSFTVLVSLSRSTTAVAKILSKKTSKSAPIFVMNSSGATEDSRRPWLLCPEHAKQLKGLTEKMLQENKCNNDQNTVQMYVMLG